MLSESKKRGLRELGNKQEACRQEVTEVSGKLLDCQAERDSYALRMEQLAPADSVDNPGARTENQGVLQKHLQHIADLETEVSRLKKVCKSCPQKGSDACDLQILQFRQVQVKVLHAW